MDKLMITRKALMRLYRIIAYEMKDWQIDEPAEDELRDALKEAKTVLYPNKDTA